MKHYETNRAAALRFDSGRYRVVYLAFGLEQISDGEVAHRIVERTLDWFGERTAIETESDPVPCRFRLQQNYPNPFNLSTSIQWPMVSPHTMSP